MSQRTTILQRTTKNQKGKKNQFSKNAKGSKIPMNYIWTKAGLEAIPWSKWRSFTGNGVATSSFYINNFPFPGDIFTDEHFNAWKLEVDPKTSIKKLMGDGYIMKSSDKADAMKVYESYSMVPTLFSDPMILNETPIDYRLQFAADLDSHMIGESAARGRLVNPAGRRLREHFYRFPDQCDATPIALEVFLRLMIYDQIESFFSKTSIGLWHDLFPEVQRRQYDSEELSVARWYGERYAESYVHRITNGWVYPLGYVQNIDAYMIAVGLDPYDSNEDPSTPVGLGNLIGKRVTRWMNDNDGLQRDMDFVDEEGLQRIEDHHPIKAWHQWKPTLSGSKRFQGIRFGIVTQQTFVSPSLGIFSFLYDSDDDFIELGLQDAVPALDVSEAAYIARASEFLDIQRTMTDKEKAVAELSNNKISGSVFLIRAFVPLLKSFTTDDEYPRLYDEFSMVTSGCAEYAATHAAWRHKRTYLAGRPKSIIRELAARNPSFAAAYPEAATFEPMIPSGDHPEYPSGSCAIYSAFAQAADDWFELRLNTADASQKTGTLEFTVPASHFYWTDGPNMDVTLEYSNLKEWLDELPLSRIYGGVHWRESGEVGIELGKKVGNACTRLLTRLRDGDTAATYPAAGRKAISPFNE